MILTFFFGLLKFTDEISCRMGCFWLLAKTIWGLISCTVYFFWWGFGSKEWVIKRAWTLESCLIM